MTNEINTTPEPALYTATFTLTQLGLDGLVTPSLKFSPHVDPTQEEHPAIYEFMSQMVLNFIRQMNVIDSGNDVTDDEAFAQMELDLSDDPLPDGSETIH
jgi:hypothetical protein